jgi:transcriptional regulator with XRE-family HTH domain
MYGVMDGEKIAAMRQERGLSRQEFAEEAHIAPSTVARVERGERVLGSTGWRVAQAFGLHPKELGTPASESPAPWERVGVEEKPAFRAEIDRLMAERGIESLEELRERFIAAGYGAIDRRDQTPSLWRFELHANGAAGGLHQRFVWGLQETLGLTEEEVKDLFRAYLNYIWGSGGDEA